jgi:hypothetical protein
VTALLPEWLASCRDAISLLDECGNLPTPQLMDLTDAALRKVVQARDSMIEHLRAEPLAAHAELWRAALNQVNVVLSELAGIEYPGALNREHISVARGILQALVGQSEPHEKRQMEALHVATGIAGTIDGGLAEEQVHRIETTSQSLPETERLP